MDPRQHGGRMTPPGLDWDNRPVAHRPYTGRGGRIIAPHRDHITIINNITYINNINYIHRNWNSRDHGYSWYHWNGQRVGHHYDSYGYHWWGWYIGDVYFWTRYHNDMFWWYDPYWGRWCYNRDGRWWYQDTNSPRVIYVYSDSDNRYYEYDDAGNDGVVLRPDPTPPVEQPPIDPREPTTGDESAPITVYSKDGSRMVQIFGADKSAYLYDTADRPSFKPVLLGSGVEEVRFKFDDTETLVEILTLTKDGSYSRFTPDGRPVTPRTVPLPDLKDPFGDGPKPEPDPVVVPAPVQPAPAPPVVVPAPVRPPQDSVAAKQPTPDVPAPAPPAPKSKGFWEKIGDWFSRLWKAITG